ncbi:MAG: 16S rRNA (cytidine(1402)-2'-O)-methyltransferase [bacterium]|nr:16S rRNA (cytidine(1402)-2'-O)-methyltransferase [bacterium]
MTGKLYMVATPIGNLEDITLRALKILNECDLVACEDTRRTKILLDRYQISKPTVSYHQHSKVAKVDFLVAEMLSGKSVVAVSDAGTPGISDPGGVLVEAAIRAGLEIVPIPGPSALAALVSVAGIPMDRFLFLGFLPHKKGRQTMISKILESDVPVIFFESPHRILKTLEALSPAEGHVIIGRELTKKFEEIFRGKASDAFVKFKESKILGEFTLIYHK